LVYIIVILFRRIKRDKEKKKVRMMGGDGGGKGVAKGLETDEEFLSMLTTKKVSFLMGDSDNEQAHTVMEKGSTHVDTYKKGVLSPFSSHNAAFISKMDGYLISHPFVPSASEFKLPSSSDCRYGRRILRDFVFVMCFISAMKVGVKSVRERPAC
jgi:hypothetical protein